mgnify:CR=1 FL=1
MTLTPPLTISYWTYYYRGYSRCLARNKHSEANFVHKLDLGNSFWILLDTCRKHGYISRIYFLWISSPLFRVSLSADAFFLTYVSSELERRKKKKVGAPHYQLWQVVYKRLSQNAAVKSRQFSISCLLLRWLYQYRSQLLRWLLSLVTNLHEWSHSSSKTFSFNI